MWQDVQKRRNPDIPEQELVKTMDDVQKKYDAYKKWEADQVQQCNNPCARTYKYLLDENSRYTGKVVIGPRYKYNSDLDACLMSITFVLDYQTKNSYLFNCSTGRIIVESKETGGPFDEERKAEFRKMNDALMAPPT